ncbi:hypothetical protein U9M48_014271, partial [Paspalum notatum var. saurae]
IRPRTAATLFPRTNFETLPGSLSAGHATRARSSSTRSLIGCVPFPGSGRPTPPLLLSPLPSYLHHRHAPTPRDLLQIRLPPASPASSTTRASPTTWEPRLTSWSRASMTLKQRWALICQPRSSMSQSLLTLHNVESWM